MCVFIEVLLVIIKKYWVIYNKCEFVVLFGVLFIMWYILGLGEGFFCLSWVIWRLEYNFKDVRIIGFIFVIGLFFIYVCFFFM